MAYRDSTVRRTAEGAGASILCDFPAGIVPGDVCLAWIVQDVVAAINTPADWTHLASVNCSGPDQQTAQLYSHVVTGCEGASQTFTTASTKRAVAVMSAFSGRSGVVVVQGTTNTGSNSTPINVGLAEVTAEAADDLAWFGQLDQTVGTDTWSFAAPTNFTLRENDTNGDWITTALSSWDNVSAGATGTITGVATRTAGTGAAGFSGVLVALRAGTAQVPVGFVNSALGGTTTTTSFTITIPTVEDGDLGVLEFCHRGTGDGTVADNVSNGWARKTEQLFATSTFSGQIYYKRLEAADSGGTITVTSLTNACAGILTVYRNVISTGDPFDGAATIVGEENASGNETQTQITTLEDNCMVCLVVLNSPDLAVTAQACTSPVLAARAERLSTGGTDASIAHASGLKPAAGATGAFTWAQTNAAGGSYAYALEPEPLAVGGGISIPVVQYHRMHH